MSADVEAPDEAVALHRVNSGSERQHGPILRRRKLHLSQIVDEEVQFGGDTAQTGLYQPAQVTEGEGRVKGQFCLFIPFLIFIFSQSSFYGAIKGT